MSNPAFSGGIGVIAPGAAPSSLPPPIIPPLVITGPVSSAGVLNSSGVLVRTIWSAQLNDPRITLIQNGQAVWDGNLDNGTPAPVDTYTLIVLTNNVQYSWDGVVGNSSPNHSNVSLTGIISGGNQQFIYSGYHSYGGCINDMAINASGEMYFVTSYDERMNTIHVTTTANPQYANGILFQVFRNTFTNSLNVCSDGTNVYFHWWDSGGNAANNSVGAIVCSTHLPFTFSSGSGTVPYGGNATLVGNNQFIIGIAVQQSNPLLMAARADVEGALSTTWGIWTANKTTGAFLADNQLGFPFQSRICVDPTTDHPWVSYLKQTATASAQWDPLNSSSAWTFSNGNLTLANGVTESIYAYSNGNGTKVYFEVVVNAGQGFGTFGAPIGVASTLSGRNNQGFLGFDNTSAGFYGNGSFNSGSNNIGSGLPNFGAVNDNIGIACDAPNKLIWFRVNGGQWNGSPTANPATGTGGLSCPTLGSPILASVAIDTVGANTIMTANFASASWAYTAPSGFSGLPGISRTGAVSKLNFNTSTGVLTDSGIAATSGLVSPGAIAVSPDGSTLLVMDGGTQQIKAFNTVDGSVKTAWNGTGTLGDAGGYSNGPAVSNQRFMFGSNLGFSGTGGWITYVPADGSFWFADAGNSRYLHFSSGNSPTYIEQIGYFPGFYAAGVCGNDPTRVFGGYLEYKIDYTKTLAPGNGSWTLVNNWALPNMPGGILSNSDQAMRYATTASNGRTYIPLGQQHAVAMYEMTTTGYRLASPINILFNYVDRNLNLWAINGGGTGQSAQFLENAITGFDGSNNPIWQNDPTVLPSNVIVTSAAFTPPFPELHSGDPNRSNLVEQLANSVIPVFNFHGTPASNPLTQNHLGGINAASGALQFITHPPQSAGFTGATGIYPPSPVFCINVVSQVSDANGLVDRTGVQDNAGGFQAYIPGTSDVFTFYRGEAWSAQQTSLWSHWNQSGLLVNRIGCFAPYFAQGGQPANTFIVPPVINSGNIHTLDALPGNDFLPMNATFGYMGTPALAGNVSTGGIGFVNGNYYLYNPDEWYHGGVHRWTVSGLNTIGLSSTPAVIATPAPNPYNFLAGLPYASTNIPNNTGGWTRNTSGDVTGPSSNSGNGPWLRSQTNAYLNDRSSAPDLFIQATYTTAQTFTFTYGWTRVGSGNWSLNGSILQTGPIGLDALNNPLVNFYMDVLDNTGKKILRMVNETRFSWPGIPSQGDCFYINGNPSGGVNGTPITTPLTGPGGWWGLWVSQQPQPLSIIASVQAGTMTVSYAGFTVTGITPMDGGANISQPAQFVISYITTGTPGANRRSLDIQSMVFADIP